MARSCTSFYFCHTATCLDWRAIASVISRDDAKEAGREEGGQVTCEFSPGQPGAECRTGGAELMPGIDPAENKIGTLGAEFLRII